MLSFQKQEQIHPAVGETKTPVAQQESSAAHRDDYLTVAGHEKKLKQSTIILIAVFVVGALGVWMMIRKAIPSAAAAAQKWLKSKRPSLSLTGCKTKSAAR
jgi:hypothetical protein